MFIAFNQTNAVDDVLVENKNLAQFVVVEADSVRAAYARAAQLGIWFNEEEEWHSFTPNPRDFIPFWETTKTAPSNWCKYEHRGLRVHFADGTIVSLDGNTDKQGEKQP